MNDFDSNELNYTAPKISRLGSISELTQARVVGRSADRFGSQGGLLRQMMVMTMMMRM